MVETSSAGLLKIGANASVSTANPRGSNGTWLLDPESIAIVASGGSAASVDDANGAAGISSIDAATVVAALASNDVDLVAANLITVDAPVIATTLGGPSRGLQLITQGPDSEIHVNAPILLQDGNLALRSEGDILLGTVGSTETDFNKRAIIAVGNGTAWLQTRSTGSIIQADNSAIIAANLAMIGGSVQATSWDNFTLNLAGSARDGTFTYHETNAAGVVRIGDVLDPFANEVLSGVVQNTTLLVGTQNIVSTTNPYVSGPTDQAATLTAGGQVFDTVVFSAGPLARLPTSPPEPNSPTDASDYAVRSVSYILGGQLFTLTPETPLGQQPANFALAAAGGAPIAWTYAPFYSNQAWGITGFSHVGGTEANEINYDPIQQISQKLIMALGGGTSQVNTLLRTFFSPDFENNFAETAVVQFYQTTSNPGTVAARQGLLTGTASSLSRTYGAVNPALSFQTTPIYLGVDEFVASRLTGYDLPEPELTTAATPRSSVGGYPINIVMALSGYAAERYSTALTPGVLTITPATLTVQANDLGRLYGDPNPPLTSAATGWVNDDQEFNTLLAGLSTLATQTSNVGEYPIAVSSALLTGPAAGNYMIQTRDGVLGIVPAPLTVTPGNHAKAYGDMDPEFALKVTGLRNDDTSASVLRGDPIRDAGENVGVYPIRKGEVELTSNNYVLTFVNGSLRITQALLDVAADPNGKVVGELDPPLTFSVAGLTNGDSLSNVLSGHVARDPGEEIGVFPIREGTITLLSPNYILVFAEAPFTIRPTERGQATLSYRPWTIDDIRRGRDPDTPGDAVYRTTQYENPYIPDPLARLWPGRGLADLRTGGSLDASTA
jgi:hypothetical protein